MLNDIDLTRDARKKVDSSGVKSYTFALLKDKTSHRTQTNSELYFDNLSITINPDSTYSTQIHRYIPEMKWFTNPNRSLSNYTGVIQALNNDKELIATAEIKDGTQIFSTTSNRGGCQLVLEKVICAGLYHSDGSSYMNCEYTYVLRGCGGGSSGGSGGNSNDNSNTNTNFNNPNNNGENTGGGSGSNSNGSGTKSKGVSPIIGTCHEFNNCNDDEDKIIDELTGKAKCVFEKFKNSGLGIKNTIKNFDGDFPVAHLKFSMSKDLDNSINAVTNNSGTHHIEIKINGNTINNRTVLGLVRTFAHEIIHAELYRKVRSVGGNISINDFPGIFDYYMRHVKNWQHEQMAEHYRQTIVKFLKEFDNYQNNDQFYNDLIWEGLQGTIAWNNLSKSEKKRIEDSIKLYKLTGEKNCK